MLKFISSACAVAMTLSIPFATPSVAAMPQVQPAWAQQQGAQQQGQVTDVQYRDRRWRGGRDRGHRGGWERRGGHHYYNGHRGYRHQRPGYRRYNNYWFPPAAFIAGAIVGGAISSQPRIRAVPVQPRAYGGSAHVQWCYNRYRSYRDYDNTFQPYNGPRRQCYSPYS